MEETTTGRKRLAPDSSLAGRGRPDRRLPPALLGVAFVLLWSTGYPAARIALDHSGPFTFLMLRFGVAGLVFAVLARVGGVAWPRGRAAMHSALVGTLQLGVQFGALYWAVAQGLNVGLIALVIGTMPIVTALLGRALFREAIPAFRWIGFALGFAGVALAVGERVASGGEAGASAYLAVVAGLLAISAGTLYQKHHASNVDPRSGLALQHLAATLVLLPLAVLEGFRADASAPFFASLAWVVGVNSLGAFALFFVLLSRGAVNQVAALFFLMPPVTAVIDYLVLGDALTASQVAGLALGSLGVYLATRPSREAPAEPAAHRPPGARTRLADGREVLIRPSAPTDLEALRSFFARLSLASSRQRFHAPMKELPEQLLRDFTHSDQREHVALIAEAAGPAADGAPQVVAEARYIRSPGSDAAEFALAVAEGWRRVGLGSSLTRTLLHQARQAGVRRLCGDTLIDNEEIRQFMRSLGGFPAGRSPPGAADRVCLDARR